ncbi:rhodanese-like domain-containing protein [Jannaschia donghaensis]|uniref:Molybdopterin biosynthesis protein MoeB n=1 Tax=Jannaschia donghaensis TaxID=420998 RepID=A0A0M6YL34_9RHOB|nr:rhodanese-like domain-containing protein [Jannaschia donghaensis]CTQ50640.1 molybdopterin biosynthesis protein MoeB [Jannaschia donghaensis]
MTHISARLRRPSRRRFLLIAGGATVLVTSAGYAVARRDRFEGSEFTPPEALAAARAGDILLIDIRRPDEWQATGIAEGARPLDMRRDDFLAALGDYSDGDLDRPIALICARGVRSDRVSARLQAAGFTNVIDIPEGMLGSSAGPGWLERGLPVVRR